MDSNGDSEKHPLPLSAKFKGSFAYITVKDRLPAILTKVIDAVHRSRQPYIEKYGQEGSDDIKRICNSITKLRYELQTNKSIEVLADDFGDVNIWNEYFTLRQEKERQQQEEITDGAADGEVEEQSVSNSGAVYFNESWLYVECYMYRRIVEALNLSTYLKKFDVFGEMKKSQFMNSQPAIIALSTYLCTTATASADTEGNQEHLHQLFKEFIQISLWGNRCDLSISSGHQNIQETDLLQQLDGLRAFLLVDNLTQVWKHVEDLNQSEAMRRRVDIILDNAGFELFADLCLGEFLLTSGLFTEVHFHGKSMPWFVSDVTHEDFDWTIGTLSSANHMHMSELGCRWHKKRLGEGGGWSYHEHAFWTTPHDYSDMLRVAPDLYQQLATSDLLLFKGDLHYRKLVGDLNWPLDTDLRRALRGFQPAPLCALRTLKSDVCVGLHEIPSGLDAVVQGKDKEWMVTGKYGVIQFDWGNSKMLQR